MTSKDLSTWDDFLSELRALKSKFPKSTILYRGHSDSTWSIQSTLERAHIPFIDTWRKYLTMIGALEDEITSFTGRDFQLPSYGEFLEQVNATGKDMLLRNLPAYPFLLYLRHHGFPSPFVDWSMSPFIAAFFAFRAISSPALSVSIYAMIPTVEGGVSKSESEPFLKTWGPFAKAHDRHFRQQAIYTTCQEWVGRKDHVFRSHEEVFLRGESDQNLITKYTLPASTRAEVLRYLHAHNLNAYTLMGNEDGLAETMWARAFVEYQ